MPSIDVAMARSIRGGLVEKLRNSVVRGVVAELSRRDIITDAQDKVTDVKTAFSSWDNCMKATFCKWPVIAIIIVGSLIIISILWCIIRCCCCGLSCCCSCFRCLQCGNCCGCCDPPGEKARKHLDDPYMAPPNHGYRQEAPMHATFPQVVPGPIAPTPPQYAQFDVPKKGSEDALPQMPSWEGAGSRKVRLEEEELEMENLNKSSTEPARPPIASPASGLSTPRPMNTANPRTMQDPYNLSRGNSSGYMSPQTQPSPGHYSPLDHQYNNQAADNGQAGYDLDHPYDTPAPIVGAMAVGRQSPAPGYGGHTQNYAHNQAYEMNGAANGMQYGRQSPAVGPPSPALSYNGQPQTHSYDAPAPFGAMAVGRNSPAPGHNNYNQSPAERGFVEMPAEPAVELAGNDSYVQQPHAPTRSQYPESSQHGYGMHNQGPAELADAYGSRQGMGDHAPNDDYGMRRQVTGESVPPPAVQTPYGMDPRMRNSPGPRRMPGPQGDHPFTQSPRQSPAPRNDNGFRPPGPPQSSRDVVNRTYSPAPERPLHRTYSPAPMGPQHSGNGHSRPYAQDEPPSSPITNSGGFDFTSGFSRPNGSGQNSPTAHEPYPGYKPYNRG